MAGTLTLNSARSRLLYVWMIGGAVLMIPLIYQTISRTFERTTETGSESFAQQVWGWFIPMIFPALTIMLSTLTIGAPQDDATRVNVNRQTFNICFLLSLFYLLMLFGHIYFWPAFNYADPMKLFEMANFYLGPFQGLVLLLIGTLFNKKS